MLQVVLNLDILNGRLLAVDHVHFSGQNIDRHNLMVLGKEDSIGQADEAGADDSDFQLKIIIVVWVTNYSLDKLLALLSKQEKQLRLPTRSKAKHSTKSAFQN